MKPDLDSTNPQQSSFASDIVRFTRDWLTAYPVRVQKEGEMVRRKTTMQDSSVAWTEMRLQNLFRRYHKIYWRGQLSGYRVVAATLEGCMGRCHPRRRTIEIDIAQHRSDAEVRATMLHEMAHAAAARSGSIAHDVKFFKELEKLLRKGAPITINNPEAGRVHIFRDIVPARFPLLKCKIERIEKKRVKAIEQIVNRTNQPPIDITDDDIIARFRDAAMELPWKQALLAVGIENGMVDESGRPLNRWARRLVARARKAHRDARRVFLADMRRAASANSPQLLL